MPFRGPCHHLQVTLPCARAIGDCLSLTLMWNVGLKTPALVVGPPQVQAAFGAALHAGPPYKVRPCEVHCFCFVPCEALATLVTSAVEANALLRSHKETWFLHQGEKPLCGGPGQQRALVNLLRRSHVVRASGFAPATSVCGGCHCSWVRWPT